MHVDKLNVRKLGGPEGSHQISLMAGRGNQQWVNSSYAFQEVGQSRSTGEVNEQSR